MAQTYDRIHMNHLNNTSSLGYNSEYKKSPQQQYTARIS